MLEDNPYIGPSSTSGEDSFSDDRFSHKLNRAMDSIEKVLDRSVSKSLRKPDDIEHQYDDKFSLVESMAAVFIISGLDSLLQGLGLGQGGGLSSLGLCKVMRAAALDNKAVTISFRARETCVFVKEVTEEVVVGGIESRKSIRSSIGELFGMSRKVVETVTTYFWKFTVEYELCIYTGSGQEKTGDVLFQRLGRPDYATTVTTKDKRLPYPELFIRPVIEANINWLLNHIDEEFRPLFLIDRSHCSCYTPRRNEDVSNCIVFCTELSTFCHRVCSYFAFLDRLNVFKDRAYPNPTPFSAVHEILEQSEQNIFIPVYASSHLLLDTDKSTLTLEEGKVMDKTIVDSFLLEQRRTFQKRMSEVTQLLAACGPNTVASPAEGEVLVSMCHLKCLCESMCEGADYIENIIRKQLIAAIGREFTTSDMSEYMIFHNRKLFNERFAPEPFRYVVRRSNDHSPEGSIGIEELIENYSSRNSNVSTPIYSITEKRVMKNDRLTNMEFALDASTRISFGGDRHLHAWLRHSFSGEAEAEANLLIDARPFSSFIVLIGRITSARSFDPKYAMIVKDKDSFRIPLNMEQIPSSKEFKEAVKSLSPEQQAFAQAFRSMQLESTLFGICIIQIKPQLETVLNLPPDALTKEIKLSQDLMELFLDYQIPSDLLSCQLPTLDDPVDVVKGHVQKMQDMIQTVKLEDIRKSMQEKIASQLMSNIHSNIALGHCDEGIICENLDDQSYCVYTDDYECEEGFGYDDDEDNEDCDDSDRFELSSAVRSRAINKEEAVGHKDMEDASSAPPQNQQPKSQAQTQAQDKKSSSDALSSNKSSDSKSKADRSEGDNLDPIDTTTSSSPNESSSSSSSSYMAPTVRDYTSVPVTLDSCIEQICTGDTIRATILHPADIWTKVSQEDLLGKKKEASLFTDDIEKEKKRAFSLLDSLTKSGALTIEEASLHVVIAATQCFEQTLLNTVVRRNLNPIEGLEKSTLAMATVIHDVHVDVLVRSEQVERVVQFFDPICLQNQ